MTDPEAARRLRRFERLGGVPLGHLDEEQLAHVRTGIAHLAKAKFVFRCPMCRNQVKSDQELEPMCTGPSWTDDHPPEVMVRIP